MSHKPLSRIKIENIKARRLQVLDRLKPSSGAGGQSCQNTKAMSDASAIYWLIFRDILLLTAEIERLKNEV